MSDVVSFTEVSSQHVELLPSRTMLTILQSRPGADGGTYIGGSTIDDDTVDIRGGGPTGVNECNWDGYGILWCS